MAVMVGSVVLGLICVWQVTASITVDKDNYGLKATGQGRIEIKGGGEKVTVNFHSLVEKDNTGKDVPANASVNPHKAMDLMNKDFTLPAQASYENITDPKMYAFQMTRKINLKEKNATLEIDVKIAETNGTVDGIPNSKKFELKQGSCLIAVSIKSWQFCGTGGAKCVQNVTEVDGKYLDLVIQVTGMDFKNKNGSWVSSAGSNGKVKLDLSPKSAVNTSPRNIANYPKVEGDKITIRFEKFLNADKGVFKYIQFTIEGGSTSGGNRVTYVGGVTIIAAFLVYLLGFLS